LGAGTERPVASKDATILGIASTSGDERAAGAFGIC